MKQMNGRLVVLVAAVAVAAVAVGGVLAYRQGPRTEGEAAAPLSGASSTPATKTPSATPSARPSTRPSAPSSAPTSTGQTKITLNLGKLAAGREPQVPYLIGREVRGGAGPAIKVPGKDRILDVGRLDSVVLAVVLKGEGSELLKIRYDEVDRVPGVTSLVTTDDQSAAAYAVARISSLGAEVKGGIVYAETGGSVRKLAMPDSWNVEVLAYAAGKVYFRGGDTRDGAWKLYEWTPGQARAVVKESASPTAVSDNGLIAASVSLINDSGSCSAITEVATGKRFWRTCENIVTGFTPDGSTAVGGPAYGDGYCNTTQAALDAKTGRLIREWTACFHQAVAEDDQHLLLVSDAVDGGGEDGNGRRSIIRCDITTGTCETATEPVTDGALRIGS
jgi:hypothetical protein